MCYRKSAGEACSEITTDSVCLQLALEVSNEHHNHRRQESHIGASVLPFTVRGFIENEVSLYLMEGDALYIWGTCSECKHTGQMTVPLINLLSHQ